jgi:hypothetical protein
VVAAGIRPNKKRRIERHFKIGKSRVEAVSSFAVPSMAVLALATASAKNYSFSPTLIFPEAKLDLPSWPNSCRKLIPKNCLSKICWKFLPVLQASQGGIAK